VNGIARVLVPSRNHTFGVDAVGSGV
jgi:hypothetical protein